VPDGGFVMSTSAAVEGTPVGRDPVLQTSGIWRCFPDKSGFTTALTDISLTISHGEFVCFVGPSGCGKSTLLAMLAGLDAPTTGDVMLRGERVNGPVPDAGFVFQRDLLLEWRTAVDNVLLPYLLRGESTKPHRQRARELLNQVGLTGFEDHYPWQLSGGMRQRVAICRALIGDPSVLFMDEPFGALDALTRERLNDDLLMICGAESGKTVAFVTHDVAESVFLADRVIVMGARPGRIFSEVDIPLPRPRGPEVRDSIEFARLNSVVRSALRAEEDMRTVTTEGAPR
jgi:NitT/TauT family transport system ATP-binding protein